MRLLVFGATGLVGGRVLDRALASERVTSVTAPVRRVLPAHAKLGAPIVDFDNLPEDASWWGADAAICALGTTMRAAGSRDAFRRVDHGYILALARLAARNGTPTYVLNSAAGADPTSRFFYMRVKGEVEREVERIGFESLTLVRPGLIGGERAESRTAERLTASVLSWLAPVLPRALRINPAERIAQTMLDAALLGRPGRHIIGSADLN